MIARILLAITGALWLAGCGATDDRAVPPDRPEASPALWEMTAPDGERGWLFGTMHALPEDVEWRTAAFDTAFGQAELLVVEIANLDDTAASFGEFRSRAYSDGLAPLERRVDPAQRERLDALLDMAGAEADDFADMESWAVALVLAGGVREGDPANGVDRELLAGGKPAEGLESFAAQYAMFDGLSTAAQADLLEGVALEAEENTGPGLLDAWLTGNLHRLDEHANTGLLTSPVLKRLLLTERNNRWADRVAALVEEGREPFVAVGAGHVVGADGLPELFIRRGYTMRRIQ